MAFNRSQLQTSVPLTELSTKIMNHPGNFIADKLFPKKGVSKGTGKIRTYARDAQILDAGPIGRRGVAREIDRRHELLAYSCDEKALRELILDKDKRDADADIEDMKIDATQDITEKIMLLREKAMIDKAFVVANYAAGMSKNVTAAKWTSPTSDPIADALTARNAVRIAMAGYEPDVLAVTADVYAALESHPAIVERVKYSGGEVGDAAIVTSKALASVFKVSEVLIQGAVYNAEEEGVTITPDMKPLATGMALFACRGANPGLRTAGYGAMLVPDGGDLLIRTYFEESVIGEWVEGRHEFAFSFRAVDSVGSGKSVGGYLIYNAA